MIYYFILQIDSHVMTMMSKHAMINYPLLTTVSSDSLFASMKMTEFQYIT